MRRVLTSVLPVLLLLLPSISYCELIVRDYTPARHDRFYEGHDKNFVGGSYDFSGVGYGLAGHWATLVTDTCFLSAAHRHPVAGEQVTFWISNRLTGSSYTYTVAGGTQLGVTDLWIGWFDKTVDASIARYPVPILRIEQAYLGLVLYNYGTSHRVGRNVLEMLTKGRLGGSTGQIAGYDYDNKDTPSVGGDETYLQSGDSGAPSFVVFNSRLALLGIHWSITHNPDSSLDTFVPAYFEEINKILASKGAALRKSHWRSQNPH